MTYSGSIGKRSVLRVLTVDFSGDGDHHSKYRFPVNYRTDQRDQRRVRGERVNDDGNNRAGRSAWYPDHEVSRPLAPDGAFGANAAVRDEAGRAGGARAPRRSPQTFRSDGAAIHRAHHPGA